MTYGVTVELPELISLKQHIYPSPKKIIARAQKSGEHQARIRGRGMDFAEVRNYQAGDEIRHMEWRATARTGRPHIKLYEEERERPVILLTDFNPSMYFGTHHLFKSALAAKFTALLAWIAHQQQSRVGGFLFSGNKLSELAPKARLHGILPLLQELVGYTEYLHLNTSITPEPLTHALQNIKRVLKPGGLLVIVSDFYALDEASRTILGKLRKHHDILAYLIADTIEYAPPKKGLYPVSDGTSTAWLNLEKKTNQTNYQDTVEARITQLRHDFTQLKTPFYCVTPEDDWIALANQTFPRGGYG